LIRLTNTTDAAAFDQTIGPKLALPAFVRYIGAQNCIAENEGFNGYDGMNNFYIHRLENSTSHVFISWDEDNAFRQSDFGITTRNEENVLTRKTLALSQYGSQYFSVLSDAASSATGWLRQEMQRQLDMINDAMLADTLKPYSNSQYQAERGTLPAFPEARVTYVRCEAAKQTGAARPSGCQ